MRPTVDSVERLTAAFQKLPSIGRRTAQRLTFYLMKADREEALSLAEAIIELKEKTRYCSICFNLTETDPCSVCSDSTRNSSIICVVEEPRDVLAVEKTGQYRGLYHVLGGVLSPLDGIGPDNLRIRELQERVRNGVQEVILATSATAEGETTSVYLAKLLRPYPVKVSRLAQGLPVGGDLEIASKETLIRAIEERRKVE
ncbi:MAG: recombination protein RecR [Candidatus Latescibacteria bacterium 4484_181]|nr:MAG: recombination protein RecR [Candidatus Latescibacteria bacterium 4484_181]RKY73060.1 MAG: recombination protein RecR [Candidatus Latescibacterota bacterium]